MNKFGTIVALGTLLQLTGCGFTEMPGRTKTMVEHTQSLNDKTDDMGTRMDDMVKGGALAAQAAVFQAITDPNVSTIEAKAIEVAKYIGLSEPQIVQSLKKPGKRYEREHMVIGYYHLVRDYLSKFGGLFDAQLIDAGIPDEESVSVEEAATNPGRPVFEATATREQLSNYRASIAMAVMLSYISEDFELRAKEDKRYKALSPINIIEEGMKAYRKDGKNLTEAELHIRAVGAMEVHFLNLLRLRYNLGAYKIVTPLINGKISTSYNNFREVLKTVAEPWSPLALQNLPAAGFLINYPAYFGNNALRVQDGFDAHQYLVEYNHTEHLRPAGGSYMFDILKGLRLLQFPPPEAIRAANLDPVVAAGFNDFSKLVFAMQQPLVEQIP